jgi:hypothetical protein
MHTVRSCRPKIASRDKSKIHIPPSKRHFHLGRGWSWSWGGIRSSFRSSETKLVPVGDPLFSNPQSSIRNLSTLLVVPPSLRGTNIFPSSVLRLRLSYTCQRLSYTFPGCLASGKISPRSVVPFAPILQKERA